MPATGYMAPGDRIHDLIRRNEMRRKGMSEDQISQQLQDEELSTERPVEVGRPAPGAARPAPWQPPAPNQGPPWEPPMPPDQGPHAYRPPGSPAWQPPAPDQGPREGYAWNPPAPAPAPAPSTVEQRLMGKPVVSPDRASNPAYASQGQGMAPSGDVESRLLQGKRDRERRMLSGLRSVSEGLGNMNFSVGMGGRGVYTAGEPFIAEGIREEEARREEALTPDEAAAYGVPAGTPRSAALKMIQAKAYQMRGAREEGINRRFEESGRRRDRDWDLRDRTFDYRVENVPDVDRRALAGTQRAINLLDDMSERFNPETIGPAWGRWTQVARIVGLNDPESVRTNADLQFAIMQQVFALSGKATNEFEMRKLATTMPQITDRPETFTLLLQAMRERLKLDYETQTDMLERQGRNVKPYQMEERGDVEFEIPASDVKAIEEAERTGARYRVIQ